MRHTYLGIHGDLCSRLITLLQILTGEVVDGQVLQNAAPEQYSP